MNRYQNTANHHQKMKTAPQPLLAWALIALVSALAPLTATAQWSNGRKANAVIGQNNFTSTTSGTAANKLENPWDVAVDPTTGKVFVADAGNNRILRFSSAAAMSKGVSAEAVFGQPDFTSDSAGTTQNQLNFPSGVLVDAAGRLWMADLNNIRVLRFDDASSLGNQPDADAVLGQPDFTSDTIATTQSGMNYPRDLAMDAAGSLWVLDSGNNRVLKFSFAAFKGNGADADGVLGQPNFTSNTESATATGMRLPFSIAARSIRQGLIITTQLWVSDTFNNRIMRFDNASAKADGAPADGVLGQLDLTSSAPATTRNGLWVPSGLAIDGTDLWASDNFNHRVLRFADAGSKPDGSDADLVIGQSNFTTLGGGTSQTRFSSPRGLAIDAGGNLLVAGLRRVLRFSPGHAQPDNLVGKTPDPGTQLGDGILNTSAAGQIIRIRRKNRKVARAYFTVQNEGPFDDRFRLLATRRNRKMKVKYFDATGGGANITGQIVTGNFLAEVGYRSEMRLMAKARVTKRGLKKRRAKRPLSLQSTSLDNGRSDRVLARMIIIPKR